MIPVQQNTKSFQDILLEVNEAFNKMLQNQKKKQIALDNKPKSLQELISQQKLSQIDYESNITIDYFLSAIPVSVYDEKLMQETQKLKVRHISSQRRNKLFAGFLQQQKKQLQQKKKKLQIKENLFPQTFRGSELIKIQNPGRVPQTQYLPINHQDFNKLNPNIDINDTIIENYFKILKLYFIPLEIVSKTYFFSTHFMTKLTGDSINKQENFTGKDPQKRSFQQTRKKIKENYPKIKNWYKKINLFKYEYLVIPVNSNNHWNCLLVLHPSSLLQSQQNKCRIIGLDSMFQIKQMFYDSVKVFLQILMFEKNNKQIQCQSIPSCQIIVPRQTNNHDCGLYLLCYIQRLFSTQQNIEKLQDQNKVVYLQLFPRQVVLTMRGQLKNLFYNIMKAQTNDQKIFIIAQYFKQRRKFLQKFKDEDYDEINSENFQKFCKLCPNFIQQNENKNGNKLMLKFYLDGDINYYQHDENNDF